MHLLKRTRHFPNAPFVRRLIGLGSLVRGLEALLSSFLTEKWSYVSIGQSLWIFFKLRRRICSLPSRLMCMFETSIPRNLSTLGIGTNSTFLSLHKCFLLLHQLLLMEISVQHCLSLSPQEATRSMQIFLVIIEVLVCASPNRRKHGVCCICGEGHRAKDNESCFALLQNRN